MIDFVDRHKKEDRKGSSKLESLLDLISLSSQKLLGHDPLKNRVELANSYLALVDLLQIIHHPIAKKYRNFVNGKAGNFLEEQLILRNVSR